MTTNTQSNLPDSGGLWVIKVEPPAESMYKLGDIVTIHSILATGIDWWVGAASYTKVQEPVVWILPTDDKWHWTKLSNLEKVYDI